METCGTDELCDLNATTFQFGLKQDSEGLQIDLKMGKIRGIDTPESGGLLSFPGASRT